MKPSNSRNHIPSTIPDRGHKLVRILINEMMNQKITYGEVGRRAGVSPHTILKWRRGRTPNFADIEACLEVMGYEVKAVRKKRKTMNEDLYVVRLYDGMDMIWMDVSKPVTLSKAKEIWSKNTKNGTQNTTYDDIDYYEIFPADTRMVFSPDGINPLNR